MDENNSEDTETPGSMEMNNNGPSASATGSIQEQHWDLFQTPAFLHTVMEHWAELRGRRGRTRATPSEIESLTRSNTTVDDMKEKCMICLEDYGSTQQLMHMNHCQHRFHENCLTSWLEINNTCPLCRSMTAEPTSTSCTQTVTPGASAIIRPIESTPERPPDFIIVVNSTRESNTVLVEIFFLEPTNSTEQSAMPVEEAQEPGDGGGCDVM